RGKEIEVNIGSERILFKTRKTVDVDTAVLVFKRGNHYQIATKERGEVEVYEYKKLKKEYKEYIVALRKDISESALKNVEETLDTLKFRGFEVKKRGVGLYIVGVDEKNDLRWLEQYEGILGIMENKVVGLIQ